ncbi:M6 family metalloprotease domain-containing protein, partial [candidate division WOR-3 bacterium]|nr:M6 family metalloprotease domain-containing protein [candidate division WOR-3 bacterium]
MKKTLLSAVLLVSFSLVLTARAMPPAPGVQLSRAETDERARLGIDVVKRPVRSSGTRDRQNSPGDVTPLVIGTIPFPVVAIKYSDFANTYTVANFQSMLFGTWASGSARDYYHEVSYNQFHMTGTVVGWYTAANNKAYYGYSNGWVRAAMLVKEAAQASDAAVNYADYDVDGDGYVDAFTCIHAGYGTEESGSGSDIWSHAWSFSGAGIGAYTTNDPRPGYPGQYIRIDDYTTDPERSNRSNYGTMVGIGVYCHEWGHALGLPDLYDTDGGGEGLGNWSLMAGGSWGGNGNSPYYPVHLDPWSRMELGWLCPTAVRSRNLYSIPNIENNAKAYWLMARERTFKEYFLVENRRKTRFDTLLYNSGLLIYHIDDSVIARRRGSNAVNAGGTGWRYGVALEQADGQDHLFSGSNRGDANDPWPGGLGSTTFDSTSTTPNSRTNYPSSATLRTGCLAKNIPASAPTVQCTLGSGLVGAFTGGPDSRGYSWIDSDTTGGPSYTWVDITGTGTMLGSGDDARWSVTLPASYSFYGTGYGTVWVSTNGWLSFGSDPGTNAPANTAVPNSGAPNRAVYAFWDDLNLVAVDSGFVYYQHGGTSPNCSTVVMWKNARIKGASTYNHATFAAVLFQNGRILLRYRDAAVSDTNYNWGRSATVGIEDENGTVGLQYMFNGAPKGNLLANERAIRFASSGAAVRDVGATRVIAPSGTVDSSSSTVPSCSVYNYGTTTESYSVRCRVGSSYNQTATVTGHAPGTRAYVTFAAWVAGQRGTYPVSCSTELSGDLNNANDRRTGTVTIGVTDAASVALLAPSGTVDSGAVVTPACTVANYGTAAASFNVRMRIGSTYNQTAVVTNLAPGAKAHLTFANWTATARGPNAVSCSTELTGDLVQANNKLTGSVAVRVRDVGCAVLVAPAGTVDSGTVVTPACTVMNHGTATETYAVRMRIGTGYNEVATVTNHAAGARLHVTFPAWTPGPRGTSPVVCSTELGADMQRSNDRQTGSVSVRVRDVACTRLVVPAGVVDSGAVITPACSVLNPGTATESYVVRMRIGATYDQTAAVAAHAPGAVLHLEFPAWVVDLPRGSHPASCSTELSGDMQPGNDRQSGLVEVAVHDVGCASILAPAGAVDHGVSVVPACTVVNHGTVAESYAVRLRIGTIYNQAVAVSNHAAGTSRYVTFPAWIAD